MDKEKLKDVQNQPDSRNIDIDKVGVKDIRYPIVVRDKANENQTTVANINMYVDLPHHFKGTHMSRFVEILNNHEREISVKSFKDMMEEMTERLEAESGHIEMSFPYFVNKTAPASKVRSLMDYDVTFIGEIIKGQHQMAIKVVVPVT
ncbi:MAG: GTP cyclohydrolase I FolE2, partial [Deltaproteobacteria bacterium]|nr:GTP cyclohydrolase I FolE2 [Deltaproteobacteria bacterium]